MLQPGKMMTPPEVENFLTEQRTTASFTFIVKYPDDKNEEKMLQNNPESIAFVEDNPNVMYEYRNSVDYS